MSGRSWYSHGSGGRARGAGRSGITRDWESQVSSSLEFGPASAGTSRSSSSSSGIINSRGSSGRGRGTGRSGITREWQAQINSSLEFRPAPASTSRSSTSETSSHGQSWAEVVSGRQHPSTRSEVPNSGPTIGISIGQCKLPYSYGHGVYENIPAFVEKDPGPKPKVDTTDWSDATSSNASSSVNQPVQVQVAGPNCNYFVPTGTKMEICPYDSGHQVVETRFMRHLKLCRSNYLKQREKEGKKIEIEVCQFRSYHHVHVECMDEHLKTCDGALEAKQHNQVMDEIFKKSGSDSSSDGAMAGTSIYNTSLEDQGEDWEVGPRVPSYNPAAKVQAGLPFYNPQGLTKSEKKKFRKQHHGLIQEKERSNEQQRGQEEEEEIDWGD